MKHSKLIFASVLLILNSTFLIHNSSAQCLQIESILVDACNAIPPCAVGATEGENEMVLFKVGNTALNIAYMTTATASLTPTWPNAGNPFRGWQTPGAITNPLVAALNATIVKCGYLKEPVGGVLPANSEVLVITSTAMCTAGNSFANLTDTLYVLFQVVGNTNGHFVNNNNTGTITTVPTGTVAIRNLTFNYTGTPSCSETVSYQAQLLTNQFGTYGGSASQNNGASVEYDAAGNPTYVNNGCQAPYIPILISATSPSSVCANATATINATVSGPAVTYTWTTSGTGVVSVPTGTLSGLGSTTVNPTYTPGAGESGTVTFTLTAQGKCTLTVVTNTVSINVIALPAPVISSSGGATICNGNSTVLSVTNQAGVSYTWNPGSGSGTSFTVAPGVQTIYTVTATNACAAINSTFTVDVNALPTITVASASVCPGFTATITASGASTYTWNTGTVATSISASPAITTQYTVTGTDVNGCVNTSTGTILVYNSPTVTVNSPATCTGGTVTLNANGALTYTWSTTQTGSSISDNPSSSTNYTVVGTDVNGCDNFAVSSVTINPLPTVTTNSVNICPGNTATLTASGALTYTWNTTQTGASITSTPTVTTNYTVTGTDVNGCVNTATTSVAVVNSLTVSAAPTPSVICNGSSTTLTGNGAGIYTWSPASTLNSSSGSSVTATPTVTTTYTVVGSSGTCRDSNVVTVNVNNLPIIAVNPATICNGSSTTLTANGASTYTWNTTATTNTITVNPNTTTSYTVNGTDVNGCQGQQTTTVTVNALPIITVNPNPASICNGGSIILTANGASTYTWNTTANTNTITVNPAATTSYTVFGTDGNGCNNFAVSAVTVNSPPIVTANSVSVCAGSNATLSAAGAFTYTWSTNQTGPSISVPGTATSYTVTGTDVNGCVNTAVVSVSVFPIPNAAFTPNIFSGQVPATVIFTNASTGTSLSNYWNFGNGDTSRQVSPSETYSSAGTYDVILTVIDNHGCLDTASVIIIVTDVPLVIIIPNVFSPNGDNINDLFMINGTGISTFNCKIYDRWGIFLYEWSDIKGGWDGKNTSSGKEVTDGTYYFILSYSDSKAKSTNKQGYLQLVR